MSRDAISAHVKRKIYAESMGRCMNPECQAELFLCDGDIIERAHIVPYRTTADNSYENLVVLCPTCHKKFDKLSIFSPEEIISWKRLRQEELEKYFSKTYKTFGELQQHTVPILTENKTIYENYYLTDRRELWDKFESKILVNNKKLKLLFLKNLDLFQTYSLKESTNLEYIQKFIAHVDEFENTRGDKEKIRQILFPQEINSMFGIAPMDKTIYPSTESLECFITKLSEQGKFEKVVMGVDSPYIQFKDGEKSTKVYLCDEPRLKQIFYNARCFKKTGVRLDSLNFALKSMASKNIGFVFLKYNNLREVMAKGYKFIFIYEYCLSEVELRKLSPQQDSVVVNLHRWNGDSCISSSAYALAKNLNIKLLTTDNFFRFINELK